MKLFKLFSWLGVFSLAMLATGCSNDDFQETEKKSSEIITITASAPSEGEDTRVSFDKDNFSLSWKVGDAFQVYGDDVAGEKFTCGSISGGRGAFNGNRPSFAGTKHAFYPATKTNNGDGNGYKVASFDYTGQIQIGNDNVDELAGYLYMTGTVAEDNTVSNFVLHPAILKLTIQMPTGFTGTVEQVDVQFGSTPMKSKHYKNASWQGLDETSSTQSILLDGVNLAVDEDLVVYMAVSPINVVNDTFTLTVTDALGSKYVRGLTGFSYNFEGGKVVPGLFSVEQQGYDGNITTLRQEYADGASTYSTVKGIVVNCDDYKNTYVTDGRAGILIYNEAIAKSGLKAGDEIEFTPSDIMTYSGMVEVKAVSGAGVDLLSTNNDLSSVQKEITLSELVTNRDAYQAMYLKIRDVKADATDWANQTNLVSATDTGVSFVTGYNGDLNPLSSTEAVFAVDALYYFRKMGSTYYHMLSVMSVSGLELPNYISSLTADKSTGLDIKGDLVEITVDSNVDWTPSISGEGATIDSFDATSILVDISANTTGTERSFTITVTSNEDATLFETIDLTQDGPYINDLSADKTSSLLADGSEDPIVTVDANVAWTPSVNNGASISGFDATSILVDLPENTTDQEVTYTVTVTSEGGVIVKTIDLVQLADGDVVVTPTFSDTNYTFDADIHSGCVITGSGAKSFGFPDASIEAIKLGAGSKVGSVAFDISSGVTQIRFFALPWTNDNPEVEVIYLDASGTTISSDLKTLKKGRASATTYASGSAVVGWENFSSNVEDYKFLYNIPSGTTKIQIGVSGSTAKSNARFVLFGLQMK